MLAEMDPEPVRRLYSEVSRLASEIESLGRVMKLEADGDTKQRLSNFEGEQAEVAHCLMEAGFGGEFISEAISSVPPDGGSLRFRVLQQIVEQRG